SLDRVRCSKLYPETLRIRGRQLDGLSRFADVLAQVPDEHGPVGAASKQRCRIRAKGEGVNRSLVPIELGDLLGPPDIEDDGCAIIRRHGQEVAVPGASMDSIRNLEATPFFAGGGLEKRQPILPLRWRLTTIVPPV